MASIQAAVSLSSEYGPVMKPRRKNRAQILSKGRTGPVPVQGGINQQVVLIRTPQQGRTGDVVAPRPTDKSALKPTMGSIALIEPDDIGTRAVKKTQGASITDVLVFDSLSGYPAEKDFLPFGVIANAQDLDNPNRDGAGAVQTAGTVTIINHSEDRISPGQLVYIDKPDIVIPSGSSEERPLIKEMGAHPQKFVPATRPLHWNTERNCAKTIEVEIETLIKEKIHDDAMDDILSAIDSKLKNTLEVRDKSPMYYFGMCFGCSQILSSSFFSKKFADFEDAHYKLLHEIASYSVDYMGQLGDLANKHNGKTYAGVNGSFKRFPSNRIVSFLDKFPYALKSPEALKKKANEDKIRELISVLIKKYIILSIDCYTEIVYLYRSKVIGKALDYALPGKQLTIQMGYNN